MNEIDLVTKRRRRLRYRANHRGIKEMDIILGGFADGFIDQLSVGELDVLEQLMEQNDRDLLQWFTGELSVPDEFNTELFARILNFARSGMTEQRSGITL
ncbi:MAG: succinate dehydrogenase assembly factor 2 [Hyphomicrobiales bacterium]|nr:succinate dehydrogenase assembly factor 2 [Hyphomicrobiales bacterium]